MLALDVAKDRPALPTELQVLSIDSLEVGCFVTIAVFNFMEGPIRAVVGDARFQRSQSEPITKAKVGSLFLFHHHLKAVEANNRPSFRLISI